MYGYDGLYRSLAVGPNIAQDLLKGNDMKYFAESRRRRRTTANDLARWSSNSDAVTKLSPTHVIVVEALLIFPPSENNCTKRLLGSVGNYGQNLCSTMFCFWFSTCSTFTWLSLCSVRLWLLSEITFRTYVFRKKLRNSHRWALSLEWPEIKNS